MARMLNAQKRISSRLRLSVLSRTWFFVVSSCRIPSMICANSATGFSPFEQTRRGLEADVDIHRYVDLAKARFKLVQVVLQSGQQELRIQRRHDHPAIDARLGYIRQQTREVDD